MISLASFALAYALDWLIGDPAWLPHPVRWMGRMISAGERVLRTIARTPGGALRGIGLEVLASAANFLLAKLPHGSGGDLQSWLESERILIRRCDSFHGLSDEFIRVAVRSSSDNERLVSLIEKWLKG